MCRSLMEFIFVVSKPLDLFFSFTPEGKRDQVKQERNHIYIMVWKKTNNLLEETLYCSCKPKDVRVRRRSVYYHFEQRLSNSFE